MDVPEGLVELCEQRGVVRSLPKTQAFNRSDLQHPAFAEIAGEPPGGIDINQYRQIRRGYDASRDRGRAYNNSRVINVTKSKNQSRLAWLAGVLVIGFFTIGLATHDISGEVAQRVWRDIVDRPGGPLAFRFILQPAMATMAALRDGIRDAKTGRSPYFWALLSKPEKRGERLREGLYATSRIILLGLAMDTAYQFIVMNSFYPSEVAIVAILLAALPYVLLRGPITRVARWWLGDAPAGVVH
ncbi:MAG TPA: hypothetical protein VMV81_10590 [Phycisphaerae bacterium]|nr:hypothetical protein [Phycisphaerae bacterium]